MNPVKKNEAQGAKGEIVQASPTPTAQPQLPAVADGGEPRDSTADAKTGQPEVGGSDGGGVTGDKNTFHAVSKTPPSGLGAVESAEANATAVRALQEKLSKLEDRYAASGQQELGKQPLDELSKEYTDLLADEQLPPNARKVAEFRASQLKLRQGALAEMALAKKAQEEAAQKQRDLKAEQEELAARVAAQKIEHYAACGRLMQSSLQVGGQTLYRLVDPANGHLVLYIRSGDVPVGANLQKFVAVNGQIVKDDAINLTYVQPESVSVIDPALLNTRIFADYAPQSMSTPNTSEAAAR